MQIVNLNAWFLDKMRIFALACASNVQKASETQEDI